MSASSNLVKGLSLALFSALFLGASNAWADMAVFTTTIPASDAGGQYSLPTSASFILPQFNTALGTLTGVSIEFQMTYEGEVDIVNLSGMPQSFTNASSSFMISINAPTAGGPTFPAAYSVPSGILPTFFNPFPGPENMSSYFLNPLAASFGPYEGVGDASFSLTYSAFGSYSGSTASNAVDFGGDANSSGSATITYTYAPVPEPTSLLLLGSGLLGLAIAAARRRN